MRKTWCVRWACAREIFLQTWHTRRAGAQALGSRQARTARRRARAANSGVLAGHLRDAAVHPAVSLACGADQYASFVTAKCVLMREPFVGERCARLITGLSFGITNHDDAVRRAGVVRRAICCLCDPSVPAMPVVRQAKTVSRGIRQ